MRSRRSSSLGFTLLELSIVLVIIGLIVGGILVGRDLIRAAELKKIYSEYQQYDIAANAYKLKYNSLAGDDRQAYNYFGNACGTDTTDIDVGCNGTGDARIGYANGSDDQFGEEPKFFEHLSRAQLIGDNFDGSCPALGPDSCEYFAGVNVPKSSFGNAVWGIVYQGCEQCTGVAAMINYNFFVFSSEQISGAPSKSFSSRSGGVLSALDMWQIDSKYDDGKPNTGRITTYTDEFADATYCVSNQVATATYNLTTATIRCSAYFRMSGF